MKTTTVALYLRVSSKLRGKAEQQQDCRQQTENQKLQLERFAASQGWAIAAVFEDHESGTKAARPGFTALMDAASRHEFDLVLVWALDRWSREGIGRTCDYLRKLAGWHVAFRSYSESFLDTSGPFGELVTALFAFFAEFEHKRIIERTVAGLARAKARGTVLGHHRDVATYELVRSAHAAEPGLSQRTLAQRIGTSRATVARALGRAA